MIQPSSLQSIIAPLPTLTLIGGQMTLRDYPDDPWVAEPPLSLHPRTSQVLPIRDPELGPRTTPSTAARGRERYVTMPLAQEVLNATFCLKLAAYLPRRSSFPNHVSCRNLMNHRPRLSESRLRTLRPKPICARRNSPTGLLQSRKQERVKQCSSGRSRQAGFKVQRCL